MCLYWGGVGHIAEGGATMCVCMGEGPLCVLFTISKCPSREYCFTLLEPSITASCCSPLAVVTPFTWSQLVLRGKSCRTTLLEGWSMWTSPVGRFCGRDFWESPGCVDLCVCVSLCVCACMRACVRACVRACMHTCVVSTYHSSFRGQNSLRMSWPRPLHSSEGPMTCLMC